MHVVQRISRFTAKVNIAPSRQIGNMDTRQGSTTVERRIANACDTLGDGDTRQSGAIGERILAYGCYVIAYGNTCQSIAVRESIIANVCYTIGNNEFCNQFSIEIQIMRIIQRIGIRTAEFYITPSRQIGNVNTRQGIAIGKRRITNARDAIRYGDAL